MDRIKCEIEKIHKALLEPPMRYPRTAENEGKYQQLYAAQQGLEWALEPDGAKSPYNMIMGIASTPEDCQARSCPLVS